MKLAVVPKQTDELVPTPIVHQTAFWGRVHRRMGFDMAAFDLELRSRDTRLSPPRSEHGDFLVMRTPVGNDVQCAYVPYGPELAPSTEDVGTFLEDLSRKLQPLLGERCAFIRWDLPWTSIHAQEARDFDDAGQWHGPPAGRLRELRMNFGTYERNLWKSPRDLLPADTVVIDLVASEAEIMARMHHKTRYNIRLAERRGVVVEIGGAGDLAAWYELYLETTRRHDIEPMPITHFQAILDEDATASASPATTLLLLARHEGRLLAGMLLALTASRATYLYGASTREHRDLMASYALQWAAIQAGRAHGCTDYDMLGAAPRNGTSHPLAGVHRFKVGFGGHLVHREGCWDFPFDERTYRAWRGFEESQVVQRGLRGG